jgi:NADPH oxidase
LGLIQLSYVTYGELLLSLPLLFLLLVGYYFCFYSPNVEVSGNVASYALIASFLTANKSSSIFSFVLGIPFERLLGYHKLTACCAVVLSAIHTYVVFNMDQENWSVIGFATRDINNALGSLIFLCLGTLTITSFFPILRRWNYDLWLFIHIGMGVTIALPWAIHSVNLVWLPLFWFILDWFVRYGIMASCRYRTQATFRQIHSDVVEIKFPKPAGLDYNPGQFLRIAIPKLSIFQFHPFSISSAPHEEFITIHVRALGNWTEQLMQLAQQKQHGPYDIWIEGPYGALSVDLNSPRYGMVLFVCGGIGVTHCRSVLRSLIHAHDVNERRFDKMRFIWAVRELELVENLPLFEDRMQQSSRIFIQPQGVASDEDGVEAVHRLRTIERTSDYPFFQTEAYVTNSKKCVDEECCDFGLMDRQLVVRQGRPNLEAIVSEMAEEALGKGITHVAVFGCGPQMLIGDLKEACRMQSKSVVQCKGVTFDLHQEVFEF